jgi:hypothetical protein
MNTAIPCQPCFRQLQISSVVHLCPVLAAAVFDFMYPQFLHHLHPENIGGIRIKGSAFAVGGHYNNI